MGNQRSRKIPQEAELKALFAEGHSNPDLAARFGVTRSAISRARRDCGAPAYQQPQKDPVKPVRSYPKDDATKVVKEIETTVGAGFSKVYISRPRILAIDGPYLGDQQ